VSYFLTIAIIFFIISFTHVGTIVFNKIFLGPIQAAVVANPAIVFTGILTLYLIFDRSVLNLLLAFIVLLTLTVITYPVLTPNMKHLPETEGVKILSANMLFSNEHAAGDLLNIASYNADIIMLQEFNTNNVTEEILTIVEEKYPHSLHSVGAPLEADGDESSYEYSDKEHRLGLTIFSKTPLVEVESNGRLFQNVTTAIQDNTYSLINVHTVSPVTHSRHVAWLDSFQQITSNVEHTNINHPNHTLIIAGDFNANHYHSPFRELVIKNNLYQNRNQQPTWGVNAGGSLKLFKLDHVLTNSKAHPTVTQPVQLSGSDHNGILATVFRLH